MSSIVDQRAVGHMQEMLARLDEGLELILAPPWIREPWLCGLMLNEQEQGFEDKDVHIGAWRGWLVLEDCPIYKS